MLNNIRRALSTIRQTVSTAGNVGRRSVGTGSVGTGNVSARVAFLNGQRASQRASQRAETRNTAPALATRRVMESSSSTATSAPLFARRSIQETVLARSIEGGLREPSSSTSAHARGTILRALARASGREASTSTAQTSTGSSSLSQRTVVPSPATSFLSQQVPVLLQHQVELRRSFDRLATILPRTERGWWGKGENRLSDLESEITRFQERVKQRASHVNVQKTKEKQSKKDSVVVERLMQKTGDLITPEQVVLEGEIMEVLSRNRELSGKEREKKVEKELSAKLLAGRLENREITRREREVKKASENKGISTEDRRVKWRLFDLGEF